MSSVNCTVFHLHIYSLAVGKCNYVPFTYHHTISPGYIDLITRRQMQLLRSVGMSLYHFPRGHKLDHLSANTTTAFHSHITLPFPKVTINSTTRRQTKLLGAVQLIVLYSVSYIFPCRQQMQLRSIPISPYHSFPKGK